MMKVFSAAMNLISSFVLILFLCVITTESADPLAYRCPVLVKTNGGSQTSRIIDTLLSMLVKGTIQNGFIATSYGKGDDKHYGLAQCRGDVSRNDCSTCIQDAAKEIRKLCQMDTDARIWYDYCFLRYFYSNFSGRVDISNIYICNVQNVTDPHVFNKKLAALMDQITSQAVKPESKGLGKGKTDISESIRLYALVQCTRDLSQKNCAQCLDIAIRNFPNICNNRRGIRVLYDSCYLRYEVYPFFFPLDSQESSKNHSSEKYKSVVAFNN